jgi:hypothetical protein
MGYSARIKIDAKRPKKDNTSKIFLRVIINRKVAVIDLDISWPAAKFHPVDYCKPRHRSDEDVEEYNVIIRNALSKANSIHKNALIRDMSLTRESFLRDYKSNINRSDFIEYFKERSAWRLNKRIISARTYKLEGTVLNHLKLFAWSMNPHNKGKAEPTDVSSIEASLPFNEFNNFFGKNFDVYLKRKGCNKNSRWGYHKVVETYLNMASDPKGLDKLVFDDPYEKFKNKQGETTRGPLQVHQLTKLIDLYLEWRDNPLTPITWREIKGMKDKGIYKPGEQNFDDRQGLTGREVVALRKFLFSCNSALRASDMQNLDLELFKDGEMSITPMKTEDHGTKINSVPLSDIAKMLLADEIAFVKRQMSDDPYIKIQRQKNTVVRIFQTFKEQTVNDFLKRIARKAGLDVNLHMHVGRYTFGSISDEAGANHTALMKQMGIRKRETLEKYTKTNKKRIEANVQSFNSILKTPPISG